MSAYLEVELPRPRRRRGGSQGVRRRCVAPGLALLLLPGCIVRCSLVTWATWRAVEAPGDGRSRRLLRPSWGTLLAARRLQSRRAASVLARLGRLACWHEQLCWLAGFVSHATFLKSLLVPWRRSESSAIVFLYTILCARQLYMSALPRSFAPGSHLGPGFISEPQRGPTVGGKIMVPRRQ